MRSKLYLNRIILITFLTAAVIVGFWLWFQPVFAQQDTFGLQPVSDTVKLGSADIRVTIAKIIRAALGLLGIVAVGLLLYAGVLWMTAGGSEDKIATAKKIILNSVIGLAIILSAFSITQFVLKKLSEATGSGSFGDADPKLGCVNLNDCYVPVNDTESCLNNYFVVKSITPRQDKTGMNNAVVRTIFNQSVSTVTTPLNKVLSITQDSADVSDKFNYAFISGSNDKVIEAKYTVGEDCYADGTKCLPTSTYKIVVNPELKSKDGKDLKIGNICNGFAAVNTAQFGIDTIAFDTDPPLIAPLAIIVNGNTTTQKDLQLPAGKTYPLITTITDDHGVGYTHLHITSSNGQDVVNVYDGPLIKDGSDKPFTFKYNISIGSGIAAFTKYTVTVTAYDIDHNKAEATIAFVVTGWHCANTIQDEDESSVDTGGSCGGGENNSCKINTDCKSGFKCIDNTCKAYPVITNIDPLNGASGNWITVLGKNFGNKLGQVDFATDHNNNGTYDTDEWIPAQIAQCSGSSSWHEDWAIAEVPAGSTDGSAGFSLGKNYVMVGDAPVYKFGSGAFSAESWVKLKAGMPLDNENNVYHILFKGNFQSNIMEFALRSGPTYKGLFFRVADGQGGYKDITPSSDKSQVFLDNNWHQVAFTRDSLGKGRLYIDGEEVGILEGMAASVDSNHKLALGISNPGDNSGAMNNSFSGSLDEIAIYSDVLSKDEINKHYQVFKTNQGSDAYQNAILNAKPVSYWKLGETNGSTAFDSGLAKLNGTYSGGINLSVPGIFGPPKIGVDAKSAIRITQGDNTTYVDTTVDAFGPLPGGDGLFTKNAVKRPGLCSVTTAQGAAAALPKTPVKAVGSGLGNSPDNSSIKFGPKKDTKTNTLSGGYVGVITSWTDKLINTVVPENIQGDMGVYAIVGGEISNGVKFTVLTNDDLKKIPVISSIDPPSSTPHSYVTIKGSGFGEAKGIVYLSSKKSDTCSGPDADCKQMSVDLPDYCGDNWNDKQIIAKVPEYQFNTYYIIVKRGETDGFTSNGEDTFTIKSGKRLPSICVLEPNTGPAPLPEGQFLKVSGINFSSDPRIYFWSKTAIPNDLSTWLSAEGNDLIKITAGQVVKTLIPSKNGYSMQTGPIKLKSDGELSNSLIYTVIDCKSSAGKPGANYTCCQSGPDAGLWKEGTYACAGESREAGYVWRFTTGIIPKLPEVVEDCSDGIFPSPTPWDGHKNGNGESACVNSTVAVRFNMSMDKNSFGNATVALYKCDTVVDGGIDCDKKKEKITNVDLLYESGVLKIHQNPPDLEKNAWYRVELSSNIQSAETVTVLGKTEIKYEKLRATRPCGSGTAYCFNFKTGSELCTLTNAWINPPQYTTQLLGMIQNPAYPYNFSDLFNPAYPYYYYVWGEGNQACSVLNVDGLGWQWGSADTTKATSAKSESLPQYTDSRATVTALQHTAPQSVNITASTNAPIGQVVVKPEIVNFLQLAGKNSGYEVIDNQSILSIAASQSSAINLPSPFTLDVSFKFNTQPQLSFGAVIMSKASAYELKLMPGGAGDFCFIVTNGSSICVNDAPLVKIHHFVIVWDGKQIKLYKAAHSSKQILVSSIPVAPSALKIGGSAIAGFKPVPQTWYAARLVPKALTTSDVDSYLYNFNLSDEELAKKFAINEVKTVPVVAKSPLTIDLADPIVVYFEPACQDSCLNTDIIARFNRQMATNTYAAGFKFYKCADPNCVQYSPDGSYEINFTQSTPLELRASLGVNSNGTPKQLAANAYYKVELTNDIKSLTQLSPLVLGKGLKFETWKFKTKNDSKPCKVSKLEILPAPFTAFVIGQQDKFVATPYSEPNACSKFGQALNKWEYGYDWSTGNSEVASISKFNTGYGFKPYCSVACLKKGSDTNVVSAPLCGNSVVDQGEDCDIGLATEVPGISCGLTCVRPGNSTAGAEVGQCGNNIVETDKGEQCDPGNSNGAVKTDDPYCSDTCRLKGSVANSNQIGASICGDGIISKGEACDTKINNGIGCTDQCLLIGAPLAASWCENNSKSAPQKDEACVYNVSICGNKIVELEEECEVGVDGATASTCSSSCLLQNVCNDDNLKQCDKGEEGCNSDCTRAGSSPYYSIPSLCGDSKQGLGEDGDCENTSLSKNLPQGDGPVQIVTAVGSAPVVDGAQATTINTVLAIDNKVQGKVDYTLQCGFTEYPEKKETAFNNCPNNINNDNGVAVNSCCGLRPKRVTNYPADGAGFNANEAPVCRNTYIEVTFNKKLSLDSITNNVKLVQGYTDKDYNCAETGGTNITSDIDQLLLADANNESANWWENIWNKVKKFFARLFTDDVVATTVKSAVSNIKTWCAGEISVTTDIHNVEADNGIEQTAVSIKIGNVLASSTVYGVYLQGGQGGIADVSGVGIKSPDTANTRDDFFVFKTSNDICKIKSISVEPDKYVFTKPAASATFFGSLQSTVNNQLVQPITGVYDWVWTWKPANNPVFDIPVPGTPSTTDIVIIGAREVEGHINGVAEITVMNDKTEANNQAGKSFSALFDLTAFFCENSWPTLDEFPFADAKYNFSMGYCADAGKSGDTVDDLPYLKEPFIFLQNVQSSDILNKCSISQNICQDEFDCDKSVYEAPGLNQVNVPVGQGVCWDTTANSLYPDGLVKTCSESLACDINGEYALAYDDTKNSAKEHLRDMAVKDKYAYILLDEYLYIIDISNQAQIKPVSAFKLPVATAQRVALNGRYAYIASSQNGLLIVDISNRKEPKLVNKLEGSFSSVAFSDHYAFLVGGNYGLAVIDITDPTLPIKTVAKLDIGSIAKQIVIFDSYAYLVDGLNKLISVVDISQPTQLSVIEKIDTSKISAIIADIYVDSPLVIYLARGDVGMQRLELSSDMTKFLDPQVTLPVVKETIVKTRFAKSVALPQQYSNYTVVADEMGGVKIIDTSNLSKPKLVDTLYDDNNESMIKVIANNTVGYALDNGAGKFYIYNLKYPVSYSCKKELPSTWKTNQCQIIMSPVAVPLSQDTLKRYLFLNNDNDDAVGVQIMQNPSSAPIVDWYINKFDSLGSMKLTSLGGYEALSDGNNYYVNALNHASSINSTDDQVYNNVYLFSVNPNAQKETRQVFQQLLESLTFNINITDHGYCLNSGNNTVRSNPNNYNNSISCGTDFDCRNDDGSAKIDTNGVCSNALTKFFRDWDRLRDIENNQEKLNAYFVNALNDVNFKGDLKSGTYIPGYTVSRWPSWGTLGGLVGGLSADPINRWSSCAADDQQTCWKAASSTYACPAFKQVYEYEFVSSTKDYIFHGPLEFFTINDQVTKDFIDTSKFSTTPWCVGQFYSPFGTSCGDGVVNPGEQCDPPGSKKVELGEDKITTIESACAPSCKWQAGQGTSIDLCDNGKVDGEEACDDGALNNTYGHCNNSCSGLSDQYCGNSEIDKNINGKPLEFCEANVLPFTGNYAFKKENSCSWDCQEYGAYCGDGITQADQEEECDDNNTINQDGCNTDCKLENLACLQQNPQYLISDNEKTSVLYITRVDSAKFNKEDDTSFIPGVGHINECFQTTGEQICRAANLTCAKVLKLTSNNNTQVLSGGCNYNLSAEENNSYIENTYRVACDGKYVPLSSSDPVGQPLTGQINVCGNGKVEAYPVSGVEVKEVCDTGTAIGISCTPEYGKSCAYCANDCKKILTVDPLAYCGNGKIDAIAKLNGMPYKFETCDANDTSVVSSTSFGIIASGVPVTCSDKGSYQCLNNCSKLQNSCVACGAFPNKPQPLFSILNPMIGNGQGWPDEVANDTIGLYMVTNTAKSNLGDTTIGVPTTNKSLIGDNSNGIETNSLCTDEYGMYFNFLDIYKSVQDAEQLDTGNKSFSGFYKEVSEKYGTYFPYPVNGEVGSVQNKIIMSPAVPPGVFRVVVRWTEAEAGKGAEFGGWVYNDAFVEKPSDQEENAKSFNDFKINEKLCSKMSQNQFSDGNYWWPAALSGAVCSAYQGVYIHPIISGISKVNIQSFTIYTNGFFDPQGNAYAFYVQNIASGLIWDYRFSNLTVEVYEYHENQLPLASIYKPTRVFSIKNSAGTSTNSLAKYWHVFNLVKEGNDYVVKPVESIETDTCQIIDNIPDAVKCG